MKHDPAVDEFWPLYERWLRTEKARATVDNRRSHWKTLKATFAPARLGDVNRADVERHKAAWVEAGKNPTSLNSFLREMRALYNDARRVHLGEFGPLYNGSNPFAGVTHIPVPKGDDRVCAADEIAALIATAARLRERDSAAGETGLHAQLRVARFEIEISERVLTTAIEEDSLYLLARCVAFLA